MKCLDRTRTARPSVVKLNLTLLVSELKVCSGNLFRCDALVQGGAEKNPDPSHFDTFQREERVSYS